MLSLAAAKFGALLADWSKLTAAAAPSPLANQRLAFSALRLVPAVSEYKELQLDLQVR